MHILVHRKYSLFYEKVYSSSKQNFSAPIFGICELDTCTKDQVISEGMEYFCFRETDIGIPHQVCLMKEVATFWCYKAHLEFWEIWP